MRSVLLVLLAASALAACDDPVAQQAAVETRMTPARADTMLAIGFLPGTGRLDAGQLHELQAMVAAGRAAQRDEFVVVTDGSGGPIQQARAQQVMRSLSNAGAHWVGSTIEPAMVMGPDKVVVVRSEYRVAERNCPNYNPSTIANVNEATMGGFGCANAYNYGQMLARSRDAAVGRSPGPADATVNAAAIQRYREGKVRMAGAGGSSGAGGGSGIGAAGGTSGTGM
jgi:type IV pilus biogenesis protein CpaD/CtpE